MSVPIMLKSQQQEPAGDIFKIQQFTPKQCRLQLPLVCLLLFFYYFTSKPNNMIYMREILVVFSVIVVVGIWVGHVLDNKESRLFS